jgi:hypothetical protein
MWSAETAVVMNQASETSWNRVGISTCPLGNIGPTGVGPSNCGDFAPSAHHIEAFFGSTPTLFLYMHHWQVTHGLVL